MNTSPSSAPQGSAAAALHGPDLEAYFQRIGYTGSPQVDRETLDAITAHHAGSIPFENIDVLLDRGIDIRPESVEQKLVRDRRGGYCFEQNQLLMLVLNALGFEVELLSARVRWLLPREVIPPRTHVFVRVKLGDEFWITDVGVGGCSLTAALRWQQDVIQHTPHDARRLIQEGPLWFHQIRFDEEWLDVCEFTGETMPQIDREVANWWTSTNAESKFRKNLLVSMAGMDGSRRSISNTEFTLRPLNQPAVKRIIANHGELVRVLEEEFRLAIPASARFPLLDLFE